ncbi:MAG: aspartyl protease family protein [Bacteroidales bacterium]|nr:aspartyl protease family protein [Bacteroidales bacterium]
MKRFLLLGLATLFCLQIFGQGNTSDIKYYGHIYVQSEINGQPANLAFDTGSPYTCLDSTFFAGCTYKYKNMGKAQMGGTGNKKEFVRIIIGELTYTAGGKEYTSKVSPIFQLKPIIGDYADGLLGISDFGGKIISIDYRNEKMTFLDKLDKTDIEGFTKIAIRYANNRIYVPVTVTVSKDKVITGEALVDLGSGETVTFTAAVAKQHSLKDISPVLFYEMGHGGVGGEAAGCYFRAEKASVGPFSLSDILMDYSLNTGGALAASEYIGIVGNDFWERFDIIMDLPGKSLYLRPNQDYGKPFKCPVEGFAFTDRSKTLGCWVVNCIIKDSNAERAGLKNKDQILTINGRDVKTISLDEQKTLFDEMTSATLTIRRGDSTQTISFDFDEPKL